SDDDGLADGSEDANHNGQVDAGETNPTRPDTDGDGLQDGTERGITTAVADPDGAGPLLGTNVSLFQPDLEPAFTTNPTNADTDGDGSPDGIEDNNHNGRLDAGEYDPLSASSHPEPATSRQVPSLPLWAMVLMGGLLVGQAGRVKRRQGAVS
ncbi:MAG TPA: hypothetical protein PKC70_13440, partial [Cellvibrionaceae bacterium]|nr:hypothetical protein [Cellvibrionaceae bacterium]